METADITAAADALRRAQTTRVPIEPLTSAGPVSAHDAYRIQLHNIERELDAGRVIQGHKVGLSSRAMQQMLGVNEPDYGHLLDSMFVFEETEVPIDRFIQPRV